MDSKEFNKNMKFKDSQEVFKEAIKEGTLSNNPDDYNYAGKYMYMGHWKGIAQFKNINTREYLKSEYATSLINFSKEV